jgi:hypothetical protein
MPKIGPFKPLGFNNPTAQTEDMYFKSINTTVDEYHVFLNQLRLGTLQLPNRDLDSGKQTAAAEYSLADESFAKLLAQLTVRKFDLARPDLRDCFLHFYADLFAPIETKKDTPQWQAVLMSLDELRSVTPIPPVAAGAAQRTPPLPIGVTALPDSSLGPASQKIQ